MHNFCYFTLGHKTYSNIMKQVAVNMYILVYRHRSKI